jgi:hypothetical protein
MFSWTVRENLVTQHISSSSHLVFSLGNVSPWFLLTACAPVSPLWLAHFYVLQNARNIRTLFTTYPLITVANNNLLFKIYIYIFHRCSIEPFEIFCQNTYWHCNSLKGQCNYFKQKFMQSPSFRVHSFETMFLKSNIVIFFKMFLFTWHVKVPVISCKRLVYYI